MRLLSFLIFTVFLATGAHAAFGNIWGRFTESRKTTKECLIREVPLRIFFGIGTEYVRRTTNETIMAEINVAFAGQLWDMYTNLTTVTTWTESVMTSLPFIQQGYKDFQAIYDANPGQFDPAFPSYEGIYQNNVKDRIQEIRQDLDDCYARTMPCQWSDFGCKFSYIFNGASGQ